MFKKILIANRGEIACRVIRTARRLGIQTVAIYSDADAGSLHVAMADEAYRVGPPAAAESYLRSDRIIEACSASGAEAVHPGFGFLAENAAFAEAVAAAGLTFIGPSPSAIRAMGLKDAAKALMEKAGVPVTPGYHGADQDDALLAVRAAEIGYPVLIKARAGGGGKGMRRVDSAAEFQAALEGARREGVAAFGDGAVLVEKYLTTPRHIEIQVFGDTHGNVIHLGERDCSLQRRHQKVIEEAPAPGLTPEMRSTMGAAAVRAAKAVNYTGAGTVEFIADVSDGLRADRFYFMEMNTRLQVEHPVTEMITGLDLVEWQLKVAAGETLPLRQEDVKLTGWSVEARIYAEDPTREFMPATGRLRHLEFPAEGARIETGVRRDDTIGADYDPMIAKLVVHAETRDAALTKLAAALDETRIAGPVTNVAFLGALCRDPDFAAGRVDTGLIGRKLSSLLGPETPPVSVTGLAALAALKLLDTPKVDDPWRRLQGWRAWSQARQFVGLEWRGTPMEVALTFQGDGAYEVDAGQGGHPLAVASLQGGAYEVVQDGKAAVAHVVMADDLVAVFSRGGTYQFTIPDVLAAGAESADGGDRVIAPVPGVVKVVAATVGLSVKKGERLIVIESMKMEYALNAPRDGDVQSVSVAVGDRISDGDVLVILEPTETPAIARGGVTIPVASDKALLDMPWGWHVCQFAYGSWMI